MRSAPINIRQIVVWPVWLISYSMSPWQSFPAKVIEASLDDLMMYTRNCIMLVEAKCDKEMLIDFMPEATSQAITLSEVTRCMFKFFTFGVLITMYLVIALFGIVCLMVPNGCFRHTPVMPRETTSHMEAPYSQSCSHTLRLVKTSRKMYNTSWSYCMSGSKCWIVTIIDFFPIYSQLRTDSDIKNDPLCTV